MRNQSISISDVTTFKTCRQKWDYHSYLRKYIRPQLPAISMRRGTAYHEVLGWMFLNPDHSDSDLKARIELAMRGVDMLDIVKEIEIATDVLIEFRRFVGIHPLLSQITPDNIIAVEDRRLVELDLGYTKVDFVYYCDLIVDINDILYIIDFKTSTKMAIGKHRNMFDDQATAYSMAEYIRTGKKPIFVWVNLNTSKLMGPKLLKKGRFSRSKSQYLSMPKFCKAIEDSEQPYEFYADFILEQTQRMFNRMFRVSQIRRSINEMKSMHYELVNLAAEMVSDDVLIYRANHVNCNVCPYESACYHNRFGGNESKILSVI